ncbi:MFS transporter [Galbibacter pacificus]|uniref:MFS transporter n=1 Tax=Galbibacter pacificus TaxID=2996052 RepID=A0ABT6FPE2_9FLAO|nr:MFS transporter [Galbibacter pacificus]MDG3581456.1 MFS transporter [Galbibacter pacificus]MDG3584934.1 MFS transporter [Galbibacter pacificus]
MRKLYLGYISSFQGLSREVWWLSLITLINRAGTMVIPFLSLYLTQKLHFTLSDVGWIMSSFGLGSVVGSWLGGKFTDKIGYYRVMALSLVLSAFCFIGLQFLQSFWGICFGIFVVMLAADMFRPAVFVALSAYSKPQNKTRSVTLIRLAINLGFSAGPAIGGLIITKLSYNGLFWVDGITCLLAGVLLLNVLNPKKARVLDAAKNDSPESVYSDIPYWVFFVAMVLFGFIFLQYFSTIPIFYKELFRLTESEIGILLGLNGLLIFVFEMPLVKYFEEKFLTPLSSVLIGFLLTIISFMVLNMTSWIGILIIGMALMSFGEMLVFPFSNAFALNRAKRGNQGEYLALYSIAFSVSHIFGHNSGLQLIDALGFEFTWYVMIFLGVLGSLLVVYLRKTITRTVEEKNAIVGQ